MLVSRGGDATRQDLVDDCTADVDDAYDALDRLRSEGTLRYVWQEDTTVALLIDGDTAPIGESC